MSCGYNLSKKRHNKLPNKIRNNIICYDYSDAENKCPRKIAIGHLIKRASEKLV